MDKPEKLKRQIGKLGLAAIALNGYIGAAIFALPADVARNTGDFAPWMFLICGVLMLPVVLSFSAAASYFSNTGGPVLYAGAAFGPFIGFQTGWLLYLGRATALAANSNALVDYAGRIFNNLVTPSGRFLALAICFIVLTLVNIQGVRRGMRVTNILTFLKLTPLFLFMLIGVSYIAPTKLFAPIQLTGSTFSDTLLLVVYAFVGFEGAVVPAGESKNPKADLPKALLLTLLGTTVLYFVIQAVSSAVLPNLASTKAPLADAAQVLWGGNGIGVMTLAAFLSIAGNISAIMLAAPRMTYAMAVDHALPHWFAAVHERYRTPAISIAFLGVLGFILAVSGSFRWLAIMSSLTRMLGYAACIASLPKLAKIYPRQESRLNLPGGFILPAAGFLLCSWLALHAHWSAWTLTAGFGILGTVLYCLARKVKIGS